MSLFEYPTLHFYYCNFVIVKVQSCQGWGLSHSIHTHQSLYLQFCFCKFRARNSYNSELQYFSYLIQTKCQSIYVNLMIQMTNPQIQSTTFPVKFIWMEMLKCRSIFQLHLRKMVSELAGYKFAQLSTTPNDSIGLNR